MSSNLAVAEKRLEFLSAPNWNHNNRAPPDTVVLIGFGASELIFLCFTRYGLIFTTLIFTVDKSQVAGHGFKLMKNQAFYNSV